MRFYKLDHEITMDDIKKYNFPNQKLGVIVQIENSNGEILLQKRGIKSRDENGLYEHIGGSVDKEDVSFKAAIKREILEETGDNIKFDISDSVGIVHCYKNEINWLFVIYLAKYIEGEFKIMEPEKCLGYKFWKYNDTINSPELSESCKYIINTLNNLN